MKHWITSVISLMVIMQVRLIQDSHLVRCDCDVMGVGKICRGGAIFGRGRV